MATVAPESAAPLPVTLPTILPAVESCTAYVSGLAGGHRNRVVARQVSGGESGDGHRSGSHVGERVVACRVAGGASPAPAHRRRGDGGAALDVGHLAGDGGSAGIVAGAAAGIEDRAVVGDVRPVVRGVVQRQLEDAELVQAGPRHQRNCVFPVQATPLEPPQLPPLLPMPPSPAMNARVPFASGVQPVVVQRCGEKRSQSCWWPQRTTSAWLVELASWRHQAVTMPWVLLRMAAHRIVVPIGQRAEAVVVLKLGGEQGLLRRGAVALRRGAVLAGGEHIGAVPGNGVPAGVLAQLGAGAAVEGDGPPGAVQGGNVVGGGRPVGWDRPAACWCCRRCRTGQRTLPAARSRYS